MSAVYAFARRVDDIGDENVLGREAQLAALAAERANVAALEADGVVSDDPVIVALADARRRYELPLDALELLIEGVELDVLGTRYETFDELVGYCRRVAGTIGRLCLAIFAEGANTNGGAALADDLGVAMQLTNILRDVREDRERGRMYLPAEDLRRFGCARAPRCRDDPLRGGPRGGVVRPRPAADRAARCPQRVVRAGHDRHLPVDPRADRARSERGPAPADLAARVGEGMGRGAQPGHVVALDRSARGERAARDRGRWRTGRHHRRAATARARART